MFSSLGRIWISLLLLALSGWGQGQAFGRFGYEPVIQVPGLRLDAAGFRSSYPGSETFRFPSTSDIWSPVVLNEFETVVVMTGPVGSPSKIRASLLGAGFQLHYRHGAEYRLSSINSPFLSWDGGSVGADTPTPETPWVVVSFRDAQPPIMLVSMGEPTAWRLTGRTGDWRLKSETPFEGWIKVVPPLGTQPTATNSAAALGQVVRAVRRKQKFWTQPVPVFRGLTIEEDLTSVTATWEFDRVGAMVPQPVVLAPLGGYTLRLQTPYEEADAATEYGPMAYLLGPRLTIRFPVRRIPNGRGIALGEGEELISSASHLDVPSVVEFALSCLSPHAGLARRERAQDIFRRFMGDATFEEERFTGQSMPYRATGAGADLAAAHALLLQCLDTTTSTSDPNSLLTSLTWRRDWYSWRFYAEDQNLARRTSAIAALAGALCPEATRRLDAAMFHAGLAAERGLVRWLYNRNRGPRDVPLRETMREVRDAFFLSQTAEAGPRQYLASLISPIRVYSPISVTAEANGRDVELSWPSVATGRVELTLAVGYPVTVKGTTNLEGFRLTEEFGMLTLRGTTPLNGTARVTLTRPTWADPLPALVPIPRWDEREF